MFTFHIALLSHLKIDMFHQNKGADQKKKREIWNSGNRGNNVEIPQEMENSLGVESGTKYRKKSVHTGASKIAPGQISSRKYNQYASEYVER